MDKCFYDNNCPQVFWNIFKFFAPLLAIEVGIIVIILLLKELNKKNKC